MGHSHALCSPESTLHQYLGSTNSFPVTEQVMSPTAGASGISWSLLSGPPQNQPSLLFSPTVFGFYPDCSIYHSLPTILLHCPLLSNLVFPPPLPTSAHVLLSETIFLHSVAVQCPQGNPGSYMEVLHQNMEVKLNRHSEIAFYVI